MTICDEIYPQLSQMVDGQLPDPDRQRIVRAHLEDCANCRGVLQDLERLRRAATSLGPRTPPDHVWLEVAGQMRLEQPDASGSRRANGRTAAVTQWVGLAAALVLITIGAYFFTSPLPPSTTTETASNVPAGGTVEAVTEELTLAMQHYERAITELEKLTATDADALDPGVRTTLATNIQTIDRAITESRGALTQDPGSVPARESLFEALRRKVVVLQATVSLMNEMRKGNPAGAAEAAAAIGKQG